MKLSIVIPAYNEEVRIGNMLDVYLPFFAARFHSSFEVLVVVNGTTDKTAERVAQYAAIWPQVKTIIEPASIGKGGAVMLGFRAAIGQCVGYVDADGSTPPDAFLDLVERSGPDEPVVIASRWSHGAVVYPEQPFVRRVASRIFNGVTRILFGLKLKDTQCGAKVFDRSVVERILQRPGIITRWAFDVDLLFQIKRENFSIREVPTTWRDVEGSKLTVTEASLEMLAALVRLRLMYSPFKWVVWFYDRFLIGEQATDEALRRSLLFGMSGQLTNVFNLAFQVVMAHALLQPAYGDMAATLGAVALLSAVLGGTTRHLAKSVSRAYLDAAKSSIRVMLNHFSTGFLWSALLPLLLVVYFAGNISSLFRLESTVPIYLMLLLAGTHIYYLAYSSVLSGIHAYRSVALLSTVHSMLRFAVAAGLVCFLGWGVTGALAGALFGILVAFVAGIVLVAKMLPAVSESAALPPVVSDWHPWRYALALVGFAILTGSDVLLVKCRFTPKEAGDYALAAMIARIVFFFPLPFAAAAFSKVANGVGQTKTQRRDFWNAFFVIGVSLLLPAAAIGFFPQTFVRWMTGADPALVSPLLARMVIAYLPTPLLSLILNYELSKKRFLSLISVMPVSALIFLIPAMFASLTRTGVVSMLGIANYLCLGGLVILYIYRRWKASANLHKGTFNA